MKLAERIGNSPVTAALDVWKKLHCIIITVVNWSSYALYIPFFCIYQKCVLLLCQLNSPFTDHHTSLLQSISYNYQSLNYKITLIFINV